MPDGVTVVVRVPDTAVTSPPPGSGPPGWPPPGSGLPFTGGPLFLLVLAAAGLLAAGAAVLSAARRSAVSRRRTVLVLTAIAALSVAGTALAADTGSVTVSATSPQPSRTLYVEDVTGKPLTTLDFGRGGTLAFRVRVADSDMPVTGSDFQVYATMNNLYRSDGSGGYVWADTIPSKNVSLAFGSSPYGALGVALPVVPQLSLSSGAGPLPTCASLLGLTSMLDPVCSLLGSAGGVSVSGVTVPGLPQTIALPDTTALTDLPMALAGAQGGAFTNADFDNGIGAGDSSGKTAAGTTAPTRGAVMTGTAGLPAGLASGLQSRLQSALAGLPLVSADGTGAQASLAAVVAALAGSTDTAVAQLGSALQRTGLSTDQVIAVVNGLTATVRLPQLGDLLGLRGSWVSLPMLSVSGRGPVGGTYAGTLTVTLVQP